MYNIYVACTPKRTFIRVYTAVHLIHFSDYSAEFRVVIVRKPREEKRNFILFRVLHFFIWPSYSWLSRHDGVSAHYMIACPGWTKQSSPLEISPSVLHLMVNEDTAAINSAYIYIYICTLVLFLADMLI